MSARSQPATQDTEKGHPLNLQTFRTQANAFRSLLSQPGAASAFLMGLQKQNLALAETLLLHQARLQLPDITDAEVERAFRHYVINTREPLLADDEIADLRRLGAQYRESLLLAAEPDSGAIRTDEPRWTLQDLRSFGQAANASRYGRGDVLPVGLLDFAESASGYSTLNAVWMSEMSALAYWDPALIENQLRQWSYKLIAFINDPASDTNAYIAEKSKHRVLSFRGTSSLKNFSTDVQFLKISAVWAEGYIHHGFANALEAVWPQVLQHLGPANLQELALWTTGHSLGAALAQLTALRLTKLGYRAQAVYTYGTPRIGDSDFVADYDNLLSDRTFPHINAQDVVTQIPPALLGFYPTASKQIRLFTGVGHQMAPFNESAQPSATPSEWWRRALDSIRNATEFLPALLRPQITQSTPSPAHAPSLYSTTFKDGALDDHGSFEYLFKLACEALEQDLWPTEVKKSENGGTGLQMRIER